jgi:hypothetical protein
MLSYIYVDLHVNYLLLLSDLNESRIVPRDSQKSQMSNLKKVLRVGAEFFHADGQTEEKTDMK